jgi:Domain of unknown function (DUF4397)
MSRSLKALPLTLALAALSIFAIGCASSNQAQIRVINAIPDSGPVDVYVNGTKIITNLPFNTVQPATTPASYLAVISGSDTMQSFPPGDTINPISPSGVLSLNGSTQYTVVGVGLELNESAPLLLTDDNTVPTSGNVEFRIVNASLSSPTGGVDVYIVPPGTDITKFTPQISGLGNGQASAYQSLDFITSGYAVIVTANLSKKALITQPPTSQSGSITALVLVDNLGGNNGMSQTPLVLHDLN